jgi:hypothetical protein
MRARHGPNSGAGCREATSHCAIHGQNGLMRVIATRIEPDGTMQRRMVDTARQRDRWLWEDLAARAVGVPVPYRPAPGIAVCHIRVDDNVVMAAEHDLAGPLLDLVTAVMALGSDEPGLDAHRRGRGIRRQDLSRQPPSRPAPGRPDDRRRRGTADRVPARRRGTPHETHVAAGPASGPATRRGDRRTGQDGCARRTEIVQSSIRWLPGHQRFDHQATSAGCRSRAGATAWLPAGQAYPLPSPPGSRLTAGMPGVGPSTCSTAVLQDARAAGHPAQPPQPQAAGPFRLHPGRPGPVHLQLQARGLDLDQLAADLRAAG